MLLKMHYYVVCLDFEFHKLIHMYLFENADLHSCQCYLPFGHGYVDQLNHDLFIYETRHELHEKTHVYI